MTESGILHRDLTLDNILVFIDGDDITFKVCDFGISATETDKGELPRGKMRNYSHEAIKDKMGYSIKSDVYSYGLIIWEFLHNYYVWNMYTTEIANKAVVEG